MSKSTMSEIGETEHQQQEQKQSKSSSLMNSKKKFKGIRRRKWGKWVSEIRVPGTSSRLWLGSYSTAEAAAAAHDVASFYLRPSSSSSNSLNVEFNFPEMVRKESISVGDGLCSSPRSVQKAASDAGMAVDAAHRVVLQRLGCGSGGGGEGGSSTAGNGGGGKCNGEDLNISVDDYL